MKQYHIILRQNHKILQYVLQIVTDQQTGQKIQIVTAVDSSVSPKQQFILASPDGTGTGKVILAAPETSNAKQLIFTTTDNIVPGRIQVNTVIEINQICLFQLLSFRCFKYWIKRPAIAIVFWRSNNRDMEHMSCRLFLFNPKSACVHVPRALHCIHHSLLWFSLKF